MKKFLTNLACILIFITSPAVAKNIKVEALEPISTRYPEPTYSLRIVKDYKLKNNAVLHEGAIIQGQVINIREPGHWHKDAYIVFKPTHYIISGKVFDLTPYDIRARIVRHKSISIIGSATFVILNTTEFLIPGIFEVCSFVKGYQNAEEDKVKAGFIKVYKDSPLSYLEKGSELDISKGEEAVLKIKIKPY